MQTILAAGAFGDGATTVSVLPAREGAGGPACPRIVLLHGVHGCASPEPENKYGYLARLCTERGSDACIVETSRARRDRNTFIREDGGDDRVAWAIAAFSGKTFAMELSDVCAALERIEADLPPRPTVLWGFSLGGIIAVLIAGGAHERLLNEAGLRAARERRVSRGGDVGLGGPDPARGGRASRAPDSRQRSPSRDAAPGRGEHANGVLSVVLWRPGHVLRRGVGATDLRSGGGSGRAEGLFGAGRFRPRVPDGQRGAFVPSPDRDGRQRRFVQRQGHPGTKPISESS